MKHELQKHFQTILDKLRYFNYKHLLFSLQENFGLYNSVCLIS